MKVLPYSLVLTAIGILLAITLLTGCGTLRQVCYDVFQRPC